MREHGSPRTLLHQLIRQREVSYEQMVDVLREFAQHRGIDCTIGVRHLQRLARRERARDGRELAALPGTRQVLREFFGASFDELLGPPRLATDLAPTSNGPVMVSSPTDPLGVAAAAAQQSLQFLAWAQDDRVSPAVLEHVSSELRRIAIDYVHKPLAPLFGDLLVLRDTAFGLLKGRPHPRQARELFFVAGTVCTLLAHASHNLGSASAARAQAATAWACADQADHKDLRAWVCGTQALIEEWTDHPDQAVVLTRKGQRYAGTAESKVRLGAIEARTLARAGDSACAVAAIERATRARELSTRPDALAEFGGVLTFPHVKQLYYAGSTLALAGRCAEAQEAALEAIRMYETGPAAQRSYGDEALARVDVAIARAADDDLDGALAALEPVFNLPAGQRIQQIAGGLERVRVQLALPRYAGSPTARELAQGINGFADIRCGG